MRFSSNQEAAGWLAGMIDGEGHVRHGLRQDGNTTRSRYKCITITNTDTEILAGCKEACDLLDIAVVPRLKPVGSPTKDGGRRKPCYALWISGRDNLIKVRELVPIQSQTKREALELAITSYKRIPGEKWVPDELARQRMSEGQQRRRARERERT